MNVKESQLMLTEKRDEILKRTDGANIDNISRTVFYESFFKKHTEIKWSLLAGIVSRNAGWNMTDLQSKWFQMLLTKNYRELLFQTYERANWTIFADAYPQLLWYEETKRVGEPTYKLLELLGVSLFMQREWRHFLETKDEERLCTALIINEQHMIEETVMKHALYRDQIFSSFVYILEELAHMSYVLFPTDKGEVYGFYVRHFKDVKARIWLGKQLQQLLFHPEINRRIFAFTTKTPPTGSRHDYQKYMSWKTRNTSPALRDVYPVVTHHWQEKIDWSKKVDNPEKFFYQLKNKRPRERTKWLQRKWIEIYFLQKLKRVTPFES
jgi:hypothetical protein